jgi:hypothetical protein
MISLTLSLLLALAQADKGLPVPTPVGWESKREEAATVFNPKDLPAGKTFSVVSADLTGKVGSIKALLEAGRATLGESGKFNAHKEPVAGKSEGGWDYEVQAGTLTNDAGSLLVQIVGFRKGEAEGLILVIIDSVETLNKYADAFAGMIRGVGAPPKPAAAVKVDLRYKLPADWAAKPLDAGLLLARERNDPYDKYSYRLMVLPSEPLTGSLRAKFLEVWAAQIKPGLETGIVPLPLVRRLKSGAVVAFDQDPAAKINGVVHHGGLYLLAKGNRCVPILSFYFGLTSLKELQTAVEPFLESAEIPGADDSRIAPIDPADLAGQWNTSSMSLANYVTSTGQYAGDLTLNKDGSFSKSAIAVTAKQRINEKSEGAWKVEDTALILTPKDGQVRRYRIFGVGSDPKAGAFLVLSTYGNTDEEADFCIPRRRFSGEWFKRKD